jgi:hypothetical protein
MLAGGQDFSVLQSVTFVMKVGEVIRVQSIGELGEACPIARRPLNDEVWRKPRLSDAEIVTH